MTATRATSPAPAHLPLIQPLRSCPPFRRTRSNRTARARSAKTTLDQRPPPTASRPLPLRRIGELRCEFQIAPPTAPPSPLAPPPPSASLSPPAAPPDLPAPPPSLALAATTQPAPSPALVVRPLAVRSPPTAPPSRVDSALDRSTREPTPSTLPAPSPPRAIDLHANVLATPPPRAPARARPSSPGALVRP